ncbi:MAG TPA: 2Fe-2S iron-sulfur cluster-binding protein [Pyrinomonadaceae bacterium]|nr:2Fe-2S iron-sulfur cluster-binding protein [Pyrinomonadaceae bacterium]
MTTKTDTATLSPLETYLSRHDDEAWAAALTTLLRSIHEVDRNATQIWFAFYPLSLFEAFQQADDQEELARQLLIKGNHRLKDQIDLSHKFLFGHRYWPQVKRAVEASALSFAPVEGEKLADQILKVAGEVAKANGVDQSLVVGITAVAFMTLQQSGLADFKAAPGEMLLDHKHAKKTTEQILSDRAKDNSQGLFGFLKTVDKKWTVTYDEADDKASYKMNNDQDMAWGAADDRTRNWREIDPRRPEGPIPVECRSASCGTCWVGVLGGAEKLSDVAVREGKQIKDFGYINTTEPKPLIRLACQAKTYGAVSIVIPPWNGVFGKYLKTQSQASQTEDQSEQVD